MPVVSRPASAVVSEWSRPVPAGKTGLESRVAMQQAKQEAIQVCSEQIRTKCLHTG